MISSRAEGRRVRTPGGTMGVVTRWDPLSSGMCDTLLQMDDGRKVWHAMHTLSPVDRLGALPDRGEACRKADAARHNALKAIQRRWEK